MFWKLIMVTLVLMLAQFGISDALAQDQSNSAKELAWNSPLVIVQCVWMLLVTVGAAVYAFRVGTKNGSKGVVNQGELRGLNLPRGSLRGILALATIGSFVNVMVLGGPLLGDNFDSILAAFGTLTGSIVGFYFGTRGATPPPGGQPGHAQSSDENKNAS